MIKRLRYWLITKLAGSDVVILNALIMDGTIHLERERPALISGCKLRNRYGLVIHIE